MTISGNDTCAEAASIEVKQDTQTFVQGSMAGSKDDYRAFCADAESMPDLAYPDVVFNVKIDEACTALLTLEGQSGFDGVLVLSLDACGEATYCSNDATSGAESVLAHLDAGNYSIFVEDAGAGTGDFTLGVQCSTPACGDHVVNPGEECDDGNTDPGDGCDETCHYEASDPDIDTCAGAQATVGTDIDTGDVVHIPGSGQPRSTIGATDSGTGSCQSGQNPATPAADHVYKVIPQANGTLLARVGDDMNDMPFCDESALPDSADPTTPGCWDRAVHIREAVCTDNASPPPSEVACSDNALDWYHVEEASAQVTAGTEYYVFVDGYNGDEFGEGLYVLRLELQ